METESNLYKLVYCSRSKMEGCPSEVAAELQQVLERARKRNAELAVTGALLYSAGSFAQVLEGPLESIEIIFEAIQRDDRHTEVVVVQSGPVTVRDFPNWSMAFAPPSTPENAIDAAAAVDAVFANVVGAGEQMLAILKKLIATEGEWMLIDGA